MQVAFAFDENYSVHAATAIQSLLVNTPANTRIVLHVIDSGISDRTKTRLHSLVNIQADLQFHSLPRGFLNEFPVTEHPSSAYARLAVGELLPNLNKILYLDSDLVITKSILDLWNTDISQYIAAASADCMSFFKGEATSYFEALQLNHDATYFNSGVMLLNLDKYREQNVLDSLTEWIHENPDKMQHSDQSALNAVINNRTQVIDLRWNVQTPFVDPVIYNWCKTREIVDAVRNPAIIHYTTPRKPWRPEFRTAFAEEYWKYRSMIDWNENTRKMTFSDVAARLEDEGVHAKRLLCSKLRTILSLFSSAKRNS